MAILAEIRNFVMTYNIKQTLIAEMTKMSQPYVSRFFRGDIQDMPDRTKNVFFMWYLTCKNNPLKLGKFRNSFIKLRKIKYIHYFFYMWFKNQPPAKILM